MKIIAFTQSIKIKVTPQYMQWMDGWMVRV